MELTISSYARWRWGTCCGGGDEYDDIRLLLHLHPKWVGNLVKGKGWSRGSDEDEDVDGDDQEEIEGEGEKQEKGREQGVKKMPNLTKKTKTKRTTTNSISNLQHLRFEISHHLMLHLRVTLTGITHLHSLEKSPQSPGTFSLLTMKFPVLTRSSLD